MKLRKTLTKFKKGELDWQRRREGRLWQSQTRPGPSDDPTIVFLIPLIARDMAEDWSVVTARLTDTLTTLLHQTDPNWIAVLCGQDLPDLPDDPRITTLPFTEVVPRPDKMRKLRRLNEHLARNHHIDGYAMPLDADDLLHPDLVAHIRADNNGSGYLIERGYQFDIAASRFAPLAPEEGLTPFWKSCGSSALIRFDFRGTYGYDKVLRRRGRHVDITDNMAQFDLTFAPIPFPAAIYVLNHGDNLREKRGKMDGKMRYLEHHAITDKAETAAIRKDFRLDDLTL